jgi:hypothetical protein
MDTGNCRVDVHNGNKISRHVRTNRTTGERTLVDLFIPLQGTRWETPVRLLRANEQWPPDPEPVPDAPKQGPSEFEILRAGILQWLKHGDEE